MTGDEMATVVALVWARLAIDGAVSRSLDDQFCVIEGDGQDGYEPWIQTLAYLRRCGFQDANGPKLYRILMRAIVAAERIGVRTWTG